MLHVYFDQQTQQSSNVSSNVENDINRKTVWKLPSSLNLYIKHTKSHAAFFCKRTCFWFWSQRCRLSSNNSKQTYLFLFDYEKNLVSGMSNELKRKLKVQFSLSIPLDFVNIVIKLQSQIFSTMLLNLINSLSDCDLTSDY